MEEAHQLTGVTAILRRVLAYSDKVFDLRDQWRQVGDFRPQPQIPTHVFPATIFLMFLCRLASFNELVTSWHCDHYFHHHPTSILALWPILFIAHAIYHSFISRNLKPSLRHGHTNIYRALQMAASFRLDHWWPPPI